MVGLLNIGLGVILYAGRGASWEMQESAFPFWMGALVSDLVNLIVLKIVNN